MASLRTGSRMRGIPLLLLVLLPALYLALSLPAIRMRLREVATYWSHSAEQRVDLRTMGRGELLREIYARVPESAALLVDVPQHMTHLWVDQILNYWLYPRAVYSAHALRLAGEDVGDFLRSRRIRWVLEDQRLLDRGTGPPPPERPGLPPALRIDDPLRAFLGVVGALMHFLVVGYCVLRGARILRLLPSPVERAALSFLIGTGAVGSWVLLCFVTGLGVSFGSLLASLPAALLLAATAGRGGGPGAAGEERRGSEADPERRLPTADRIAVGAAVLLLGLLVFRAVAVPMDFSDPRYQWAHKAHVMLEEDSIRGPGFQDPHTLHFHPRYPLLIPGAECVLFLYAGSFNDRYATALFPCLTVALSVILFFGLASLRGRAGAGLATLALVSLPYCWGYGFGLDGGSGFTGYPDLAVAVFMGTAMIYFLRGQQAGRARLCSGSALLVLFAALSKAEGKIHLAVFLGLAVGWLLWKRRSSRQLPVALAAFATVVLVVVAYELAVVGPTHAGYLPDDDYSRLLSWARLSENRGRLPAVLASLGSKLFLSPRFGFIGALMVGALAFRVRALGRLECWMPLLYVASMILIFSVPYAVLSDEKWRAIYAWSAGRLLFQIVPVAFLAFFLLVLPRDSRGERIRRMDARLPSRRCATGVEPSRGTEPPSDPGESAGATSGDPTSRPAG